MNTNPRLFLRKPKGRGDTGLNPKTSHFIDKATSRLSLKPQHRVEAEASLYRDESGNEYWIPAGPIRGEWEAGEYPMWYRENVDYVRNAQPAVEAQKMAEKNAKYAGLHINGAPPELIAGGVQDLFNKRSEDIQHMIDKINLQFGQDSTMGTVSRVLSAFDDALSAATQYFVDNASQLALLANSNVPNDLSAQHVEELASTYRKSFEKSAESIDIVSSAISTINNKLENKDNNNNNNDNNNNINSKKQRTLRKALQLINQYRKYLDFNTFYQNMTELDKHSNVVMKYIAQNPRAYKSAIEYGEPSNVLPPQRLNEFYRENNRVNAEFAFWDKVGVKSENDSLNGRKLDELLLKDDAYAKFKANELGNHSEPDGWGSYAKQYAAQVKNISEEEQKLHEKLDKQIEEQLNEMKSQDKPRRPIPSDMPSGVPAIAITTKHTQPGARTPPGWHKIVLETYIFEWGLSQAATTRLLALCQNRVNPASGKLKIPCALFPTQQANKDYAIKLLYSLLHEACKADESDEYKIKDPDSKPTAVDLLKEQLGDYEGEDKESLTLFEQWKESELRRGETDSEKEAAQVEEQHFLSDERLGLFGDSVVEEEGVAEEIETDEDFWNW